ncbi:hypothetical protein [Pseudomonas sp. NPDC089396]|uniref:hypothetical protein n=1 Tax=Pseudomonas sp. NPDC089396 TaxID=3364461 RepID=UPI0038338892
MRAYVAPRLLEFMIFLSGYFFYRYQYGVENEFVSFNLAVVQMGVALYALIRYQVKLASLLAVLGFFCVSLLLQFFYYYAYVIPESQLPGSALEYLFASLRLWGYLLLCCMYAITVRRDELPAFCDAFILLSRFSVVVAVASMLVYYATGQAFLINVYIGEHLVRPQAFLSEPSSFAPITAVLFIVGWLRHSKLDIFLALLALAITFSPISILVTVITVFLYAFFYLVRSVLARAVVIGAAAAVVAVVLSLDCASLVTSLNGFERTLGRASCGVQVMFYDDLRNSLATTFTNQRLTSTLLSMGLVKDHGGLLFGFGLNSSSIFMPSLFGVVRENSLWVSILLFYGVVGVVGFLITVLLGVFFSFQVNKEFAVFYLAVLVSSTINSAGGFYLYSLLFFALTVLIFGRGEKQRPMLGQGVLST